MFENEDLNEEWNNYLMVKALHEKVSLLEKEYYGKSCKHKGNEFTVNGKVRRYLCEICRDTLWEAENEANSYWWNPMWEAFEKIEGINK